MPNPSFSPQPPKTTRTAEIRKHVSASQRQEQRAQEQARQDQEDEGIVFTATGTTTTNQMGTYLSSTTNKKKNSGKNNNTNNNNLNTTVSASALAAETANQLAAFEAVLTLMSNPSTAEQFDRHASQLSALLPQLLPKSSIPARLVDPTSSHGGLPAIIRQIAEVVATNAAAAVLIPSLTQLLELASFPIHCSTLHDQRALPSCVCALLESVSAALFEPHDLATRTQAATVMRDIIRRVNEKCGIDVRNGQHSSTSSSSSVGGYNNHNASATTGSAINELRSAVTRDAALALAEAWNGAIEREYNAAVSYAKESAAAHNNNNNNSGDDNNTNNSRSESRHLENNHNNGNATAGGDTSNNNSNVNNPNATVDGISRQLQQRNAALEVVAILQALTAVTTVRDRSHWLIQEAKIDQLIFSTLQLASGDSRTPLCVEMIWNLLQLCPEDTSFFATRDNYETLQNTLRITVSEGHVAARRELRNDILVVFGLLSDVAPDSQCASANLLDLVLELSCGSELGNNNAHVAAKQHHTTRTEDMQLKVIGWDLLRRWCIADEELAELAFSSRFFEALLCYIDVTCESKAVIAWSTTQLLELQEHVLRNLEELIRVGCDWFCAANGPSICVSYLLECPAKPASLLQHAISLLAEAASSSARKLVAETGAIPLALRLLSSVPLSRETISRHIDCLTLIADLVDRTDVYQNEFYNNRGVEILMPLLKGAVDFADLGDELMIAAVDCVWGCILGNNRNEQRFLEVGGVGALLAVLDMRKILEEENEAKKKTLAANMTKSTRFASQTVTSSSEESLASKFSPDAANFPLACLADMLMYPGASDSARKWRSPKTGRSGMQVLLSLWKMDTVPSEIVKEGTISSQTASKFDVGCAVLGHASREPLEIGNNNNNNGNNQQDESARNNKGIEKIIPVNPTDPTFVSRSGIVVAPHDIRNIAFAFRKNFKVFSAISSLGYSSHHELELEERATLTTIQQFVALCKDEVWETVSNSLAEAGVEPTDADWETLRQLREAAEQRACGLQATRAAFSEMQRRQREVAEKTFYEALIKRNEERGAPGSKLNNNTGGKNSTTGGGYNNNQNNNTGNYISGIGASGELNSSDHVQNPRVAEPGDTPGQSQSLSKQRGSYSGTNNNNAGSVRFAPSTMSITEAKMKNKQMLKSSFKYPVRGNSDKQLQQQGDGNAKLQLKDVENSYSEGKFDDSRTGHPLDEGNDNNNNNSDDDAPAASHEFAASSPTLKSSITAGNSVLQRWGIGQRAMTEEEYIIFTAVNTLRTHPKALVPIFEAALKRYDSETGAITPVPDTSDDPIVCEEGPKCIQEAIDFLKTVRPLSVLLDVPMGLQYAARDFVMMAAKRLDNVAEEESADATVERLSRYGSVSGPKMQLTALGSQTPESIIIQLVLGDGNPTRPERNALFDPTFRCCATSVIEHPVYRHVAFISLCQTYNDKPHHEQKTAHKILWSDLEVGPK